jgi:arylsulfatase A-like enzyme
VRAKQIAKDVLGFYDRFYAPWRYSRWRRTRRPMFLYLHFMETHWPYGPPGRGRHLAGSPPPGVDDADLNAKVADSSRWGELTSRDVSRLRRLYDAEVAELDARLRDLFVGLRARGLLDRAIVVFTADHGEEFREHGMLLHGLSLYEDAVRIPLVISGPGLPAGRTVADPVSLVDVAPTILALLGLPPEPRFEGRSLVDGIEGRGAWPDVVLELFPSGEHDFRRHSAGLVHGRLKLLVTAVDGSDGTDAVYDLAHDPHERSPTSPVLADEAVRLRARLAERIRALGARAGTIEKVPIDAETRDRLRALGYTD